MPDVNGPVVTGATAVPIPGVNGSALGALDAVVARATAVLRALAVVFGLLFVLTWHSWYAAAPRRVLPPLLSLRRAGPAARPAAAARGRRRRPRPAARPLRRTARPAPVGGRRRELGLRRGLQRRPGRGMESAAAA